MYGSRRLGWPALLALRRGRSARTPQTRTRRAPGAHHRGTAARARVPEGESRREEPMKDVRAQFGKTAAAYVSSTTHATGEDLERLIAVAAPQLGERALDVGCGVGHTLRRIAPLVAFAVGADATLEMMQAGRDGDVTAAKAAVARSHATALSFGGATLHLPTCPLAAQSFTHVPA